MALKQAQAGHIGAPTFSESGAVHKVRTMVLAAFERVNREVAIRSAIHELAQLDDAALRDIGLNRCEIERFARYGDAKRPR